jgi:hypothetical protein
MRLTCGAILIVEEYYDYSFSRIGPGQLRITLDHLLVTGFGFEQAQLIQRRPGATGSAVSLDYSTMLLSGIELTRDEAEAMLAGADPINVLLPPGQIIAVPVSMEEFI